MKIKDIFKKTIVRDIFTNIVYLILIVTYFIIFNTQGKLLSAEVLTQYINISSLVFLSIGVILLEMGYRKDKGKVFGHKTAVSKCTRTGKNFFSS